ncbi:MAG: 4-(cytidine 5'-diphospho)-2-C-methyl-D-erythritol kinase [Longimicrobiales bacterium]|nr:4-(cytidine 5'-diphospho)-2-C-methyl-D-erythritol kinase [Longimicrobiales bacterium]
MRPPGLETRAPAKVNLVLRVLRRRADGFHELETVFQAVSLADRVRVWTGAGAREAVSGRTEEGSRSSLGERDDIVLRVDGPDLGPIESNLAYRAVRRFRDEIPLEGPVAVHLTKKIPAGAGLGGGSSDAAAVLRCLAVGTGLGPDRRLADMAADLGSDVPFFVSGSGRALGRGRGEVLTTLDALPPAHLVLALPEVHVATEEAYAALAKSRRSSPRRESGRGAAVDLIEAGAAVDRVDEGAASLSGARGRLPGWEDVIRHGRNDFEAVIASRHPEVEASLVGLRSAGASLALLSGSGSACFGLFGDVRQARAAAEALSERLGWPFAPVRTLPSMPEVVLVS